jgi:hypothetical protein
MQFLSIRGNILVRGIIKSLECLIHLIQTNTNGIPDTFILRAGTAIFIEWKQPGKKPEELQLYRHKKLLEQGFKTLVVTDLKQLESLR